MYSVDMDIYQYATSYDGIVGLMYAIASRCASEYDFSSSFEPKLIAPFVYYNPEMGQQLTAACKQLQKYIAAVVNTGDKINEIRGRFATYSG